MKHGKKYTDGAKLIDRSNLYDSKEALDLTVKTCLLYTSPSPRDA